MCNVSAKMVVWRSVRSYFVGPVLLLGQYLLRREVSKGVGKRFWSDSWRLMGHLEGGGKGLPGRKRVMTRERSVRRRM